MDSISEYSLSEKHALFLKNLEQWIDEALANNHNDRRITIRKIRDSFHRDIQASIEFHLEMEEIYSKQGNVALAEYHKLMSETYQSLLQK